MAINKTARNILINVNDTYVSDSNTMTKVAEYLNIESTKEDLTLASNMKIQTLGEEMSEEIPSYQPVKQSQSSDNLKQSKYSQLTEQTVVIKNGYYYQEDGVFLGKEGTSTKVYLAKKYTKEKEAKTDKIIVKYTECTDLDIVHDDFCYIGGIIKHEAGNNELQEIKCIAFASYNESKVEKKTWKALLSSSYSSVPNKDTQKLKDNTKSDSASDRKSNTTRKAMISVLTNETDITDGATFWDGTDFLAWGTDENKYDSKTKVGHNKFKEYKFIEIPKDVYDKFLEANKNASTTYTMKDSNKHDMTKCSGKHTHLTKIDPDTKKEVYTGKVKYPMPASVFENSAYWENSCFYYDTGVKTATHGLSATISAGKSIFWRKTKDRLNSSSEETETINAIPPIDSSLEGAPAERNKWTLNK